MTVLALEEYQYADDGVVLNTETNPEFFVDLEKIIGFDAAPVKTQTTEREGVDGGFIDAEYEGMRTVTLEGTVYAQPTNVETYLDQLKANFAPTRLPKPLYFGTDAGQRLVYGKAQGFRYDKDMARRLGITRFQVQIVCEDPRIYSPNLITATATLGTTTTTGRGYPKSYSYGYGGAATQNGLILNLGGNRPSPGTIEIAGPVINPGVLNDDTGTELHFLITLNEGDTLTINLDTKSVRLNNTVNRRTAMTILGPWFNFKPGPNSLRFIGTQGAETPLATMQVSAQSAWR